MTSSLSAQQDFVNVVRNATERFKDVAVAEAEGYALMFGCVSGPDSGAEWAAQAHRRRLALEGVMRFVQSRVSVASRIMAE